MSVFLLASLIITLGPFGLDANGQNSEGQEFPENKEALQRKELLEVQAKAESGDSKAQSQLGMFYSTGHGVRIDYVEAVNWYRKAAFQDFPEAQVLLGMCFLTGQGVKQNFVEAYSWWTLAADRIEGVTAARDQLEKLISPEQVDQAQKRAKELRALIQAALKNDAP